jgi:hypothetical protein
VPAPTSAPRLAAPALALGLAAALLAPARAAPQAPPPLAGEPPDAPETRAFQYSGYEEATIADAFAQLGLARDPAPEGKQVEAVETVRLEVIEERDPAPRWLNVFHVVSRPGVIGREVLLRPGEPWLQTLADETRRNLAALPQLSLALVLAAQGSAPDRVRVVVVTKDVWSLRLNWNMTLTGYGLESLSVNPSETNLLGTHQRLGLLLDWLPQSWSLGAQYVVPRVLGSHVAATVQAGLTWNHVTGAREGSYGSAQVALPLWSSQVEWSWGAGVSWLKETSRLYSRAQVASFTLDPQAACTSPTPTCVPWAYLTDIADAGGYVTRSFGWEWKHDVSVGFTAHKGHYQLPDLSAYDPATVEAFASTRVPVSQDRVGPYLQYRTYSSDFLRVLDVDTLALQEDNRLGPQAYVRVSPLLEALGSTRSLVALSLGASFTAGLGDGLARLGADWAADLEGGSVPDASLSGSLRLVTPRLGVGRVLLEATVVDRYANSLNRLSTLGGDTRLRGYPTQFRVGANLAVANLEFRSRPLELFESVQVGGALFYDVGDAFDAWSRLHLYQGIGFGARVLFPQLDKVVFRVDVGFPLDRPAGMDLSPVTLFATFGQAF